MRAAPSGAIRFLPDDIALDIRSCEDTLFFFTDDASGVNNAVCYCNGSESFTEALDRPAQPPPTLLMHLVAGDAIPTNSRLEVDRQTGDIVVAAKAPGDGKVLRSSALMDERLAGEWTSRLRSPIEWTEVLLLFRDHLALTKDPTFTNNLLFWLLEAPRRSGGSAAALGTTSEKWQDRRPWRRAAGRRSVPNEKETL